MRQGDPAARVLRDRGREWQGRLSAVAKAAKMGPGECFGEMALLARAHRAPLRVTAESDMRLLVARTRGSSRPCIEDVPSAARGRRPGGGSASASAASNGLRLTVSARFWTLRLSYSVAGMRRLFLLVAAVILVDTMFYAAITPLLPEYADDLGLSKTAAGVLSASYAAGTLLAALPSGWLAARIGVRPTMLVGLALLGASSLAFAFGDSVVVLDLARFAEGVGGACAWTGGLAWLLIAAPRERRGELIGSALAAAIVGILLGPGDRRDRDRHRARARLQRGRRDRRRPRRLGAVDAGSRRAAVPTCARSAARSSPGRS